MEKEALRRRRIRLGRLRLPIVFTAWLPSSPNPQTIPGIAPVAPTCGFHGEMENPHANPAALKELQDAIYRDRIARARGMTPEERFESGVAQTNSAMSRVLEGAMWQTGISDVREGWKEVRRRMQRLRQVRDHGFHVSKPRP